MRVPSHHLPGLADVPVSVAPVRHGPGDALEIEHAVLHPGLLERALDAVLTARAEGLAGRSVEDIITRIATLAEHWRDPASPWQRWALRALPAVTGLSPAMIAATVPSVLAPYTSGALHDFVCSEVGGPHALDGMSATPWGKRHAVGPELVLHIAAGNIPGLSVPVLIAALLTRAAVIIKPAEGEPLLAALIARQLAAIDPALAACVAVAYWPGGTRALDDVVLTRADVAVVEGDDDAVAAVQARARGRVLGFGRRVSLAVVMRDTTEDAASIATALARDVSVYDQQGCLSPQVVYVESGGPVSAPTLAAALGHALASMSRILPSGARTLEDRAAARALRESAEWHCIGSGGVEIHGAGDAASPLVLHETDPTFQPTCLQRTVRVKPLDSLVQLPVYLGDWAQRVEAVGVAGTAGGMERLARLLGARSSVSRVCPIGRMQEPSIGWCHGGLRPLGALLRWVDVELPDARGPSPCP